jgi:hypothetical protein
VWHAWHGQNPISTSHSFSVTLESHRVQYAMGMMLRVPSRASVAAGRHVLRQSHRNMMSVIGLQLNPETLAAEHAGEHIACRSRAGRVPERGYRVPGKLIRATRPASRAI